MTSSEGHSAFGVISSRRLRICSVEFCIGDLRAFKQVSHADHKGLFSFEKSSK